MAIRATPTHAPADGASPDTAGASPDTASPASAVASAAQASAAVAARADAAASPRTASAAVLQSVVARACAMRVLETVGPSVLGVAAVLLVWEGWTRALNVPAFIMPAPSRVLARFADDLPTLTGQLSWTLLEAASGLALGVLIGIAGATLMAHWLLAERALLPLAVIVKVTPTIAIVPILVSWMGHNLWPKVAVAALATFFPVLINTITGFRAFDPNTHEFLRSIGASKREIYQRLRWHAALPYLFSALKVSINLSLIGAIVGEWFGAEVGIGKLIRQTGLKMDMAGMFAAIVMLILAGIVLMVLIGWVERRVLFWHSSARIDEV
jgi:NitT/TauT family transport system permease protein